MSQCNCKICRNNLTDIVNSKGQDNISFLSIKKYLIDNHNLDVTENVIKRHLKTFEIEPSKEEYIPPKNIIGDSVIDNQNKMKINLNDVTLQGYNFDENNPKEIVRYLQTIHLALYLKQLEITFREVEEYNLGHRENYPSVAVNNLKKLYELLDSISGISLYSNQQAAIKTVELLGLKIDKFESYLLPENKNVV